MPHLSQGAERGTSFSEKHVAARMLADVIRRAWVLGRESTRGHLLKGASSAWDWLHAVRKGASRGRRLRVRERNSCLLSQESFMVATTARGQTCASLESRD